MIHTWIISCVRLILKPMCEFRIRLEKDHSNRTEFPFRFYKIGLLLDTCQTPSIHKVLIAQGKKKKHSSCASIHIFIVPMQAGFYLRLLFYCFVQPRETNCIIVIRTWDHYLIPYPSAWS